MSKIKKLSKKEIIIANDNYKTGAEIAVKQQAFANSNNSRILKGFAIMAIIGATAGMFAHGILSKDKIL